MKLYELIDELKELTEMTDSEDIPEDVIRDTLEGLTGEINEKAEQIALTIKQLSAEAAAIKAEEKRLAERRQTKENAAESIKNYLSEMLQCADIASVETPKCRLSFRASKSVEIDDEFAFIEWAQRNDKSYLNYALPKISKSNVKDALIARKELPGAHIVEKKNLQIK